MAIENQKSQRYTMNKTHLKQTSIQTKRETNTLIFAEKFVEYEIGKLVRSAVNLYQIFSTYTVCNCKSGNIALNSKNLDEIHMELRPNMRNNKILFNQTSTALTRVQK